MRMQIFFALQAFSWTQFVGLVMNLCAGLLIVVGAVQVGATTLESKAEKLKLQSLQRQFKKAVKKCGGPVEAPEVFKSQGVLLSTPQIKKFLQNSLSLAEAQKLVSEVKKVIPINWPLHHKALKVRHNQSSSKTVIITVYMLSKNHRSPYLKILKQHLQVLIRRYDSLNSFAAQHEISPHHVVDFLSPHFIPEASLLTKIFKIFHDENYSNIKDSYTHLIDNTKTLTEFSSRSLSIALDPVSMQVLPWPQAQQPKPEAFITLSLNNLPHLRKNLHHMIQYLWSLSKEFKGIKKFTRIMSHHYKFNNEKMSASNFFNQLHHIMHRYRQPNVKQQLQTHSVYMLFDLIEHAQYHLNNNLSREAPELEKENIVLYLPEHNLRLDAADMEHVKAHIHTFINYYRHLVYNVYKGAPNLAKILNLNVNTVHMHLNPKRLSHNTSATKIKTILKNIIRAQQLAQNKALFKQKMQSLNLPKAKVSKIFIPAPYGPIELNLAHLEHLQKHRPILQQYLNHLSQDLGGVRSMVQLMRLSHQLDITDRDVFHFLSSSHTLHRDFVYARLFELIDKAQPYTKKTPAQIQQLLNKLQKHQSASSASFTLEGQKYNFNLKQGFDNIDLLQKYIKLQIENLSHGDISTFARKIQINIGHLRTALRLKTQRQRRPPAAVIQRLFYIIQEAQKINLSIKPPEVIKPAIEPTTMSPLHKAVRQGDTQQLRQAIEEHILYLNTPAPDSNETPLHWAAFEGDAQAVEILLAAGASVAPIHNLYPIQEAVRSSSLPTLKAFIQHGAPLDVVSDNSNLLDIALARQHFLNRKVKAGYVFYRPELEQAIEMLKFLRQQGLKALYYQSHQLPQDELEKACVDLLSENYEAHPFD